MVFAMHNFTIEAYKSFLYLVLKYFTELNKIKIMLVKECLLQLESIFIVVKILNSTKKNLNDPYRLLATTIKFYSGVFLQKRI